jgi:hypothetical protein
MTVAAAMIMVVISKMLDNIYHILDKKTESTRVFGVLPARRGRYLGSLNLSHRETMMADIPRHITTLR